MDYQPGRQRELRPAARRGPVLRSNSAEGGQILRRVDCAPHQRPAGSDNSSQLGPPLRWGAQSLARRGTARSHFTGIRILARGETEPAAFFRMNFMPASVVSLKPLYIENCMCNSGAEDEIDLVPCPSPTAKRSRCICVRLIRNHS
jgi:hypothetical protein